MKEIIKGLKVLFLTLFAYLFQACAMHYFAIGGVMASLPFATLAVFVVSLGKKYAFCASCIIGICTECMLANVPAMYLIAYPVITMLCAQLFADLSDRQRERRFNDHKGQNLFSRLRRKELPPLLRIPLCATVMDLIWHVIMCVYLYLIGVELEFSHFSRLFRSVLYTTGLTAALMVPMRAWLGMYRKPKRKKKKDDDEELPLLRARSFQEEEDENEAYNTPANDKTDSIPLQPDLTEEEYDPQGEYYPEEGDWQ